MINIYFIITDFIIDNVDITFRVSMNIDIS